MNDHDEEIERKLGIEVERRGGQHQAQFNSLPGVSITGFGSSPDKAVKSLLLRTVWTAGSHMDKITERLHGSSEELRVSLQWHWDDAGVPWLTIINESGKTCLVQCPKQPKETCKIGRDNIGFATQEEYEETARRLKEHQKRLYEAADMVFEKTENKKGEAK